MPASTMRREEVIIVFINIQRTIAEDPKGDFDREQWRG